MGPLPAVGILSIERLSSSDAIRLLAQDLTITARGGEGLPRDRWRSDGQNATERVVGVAGRLAVRVAGGERPADAVLAVIDE